MHRHDGARLLRDRVPWERRRANATRFQRYAKSISAIASANRVLRAQVPAEPLPEGADVLTQAKPAALHDPGNAGAYLVLEGDVLAPKVAERDFCHHR